MRNPIFSTALAAFALAAPLAVQATVAQAQVIQGTERGARHGAEDGSDAAGPVGGIVGGAVGAGVGAATGAVGAVFGHDDRPRFHDYAVREHRPSYRWDGDVVVGAELPRHGVTYYEVPDDYHVNRRYRYAVVNDRTVIVDPETGRVVDVVE